MSLNKPPVLLIFFNRPHLVLRVMQFLSVVKPTKLYVFQDGARDNNSQDIVLCQEARRVVQEMISWPCQVRSFYSVRNLGCGPGPAAAISWFFENEEQGIILEDDTVPHPDFYQYASELLNKYKDDNSVFAIGSMNVDQHPWGTGSYYFSRMNRNLCAWATWRRVWKYFDLEMKSVTKHQLDRVLRSYHCDILERLYWKDRLDEVHKNGCEGKSWDMQFFMAIWLNKGKGIIPNVNLSSNIGTVDGATHVMASGNIIDNVPTQPILPLVYPEDERIQFEADKQFHYRYFEPSKKKWNRLHIAYYIFNRRIKDIVGHQGPWIKRKP